MPGLNHFRFAYLNNGQYSREGLLQCIEELNSDCLRASEKELKEFFHEWNCVCGILYKVRHDKNYHGIMESSQVQLAKSRRFYGFLKSADFLINHSALIFLVENSGLGKDEESLEILQKSLKFMKEQISTLEKKRDQKFAADVVDCYERNLVVVYTTHEMIFKA